MAEAKVRCAVYTRKSTEEGLDQAFNSLDAQRDACSAYIASQRHEGWVLIDEHYDDGGFSGGSIDRPALRRLMSDIELRRVDVVVIYKIDRLTRSLNDFAKIVEVFDKAGASFVSVTQSFNTQTSMGRLMLHVLLSFAQFEREVAAERIRDKIAASKRKGMWMGGNPPLGYDVKDRKLVINQAEAATVRRIMEKYVELGSVVGLTAWLNDEGILTKFRRADRIARGGLAFRRGGVRCMLTNHLFVGEINFKGSIYPGQHSAIIDRSLWDQVQGILKRAGVEHKEGRRAIAPSLLSGLLYDSVGRKMTPSHTVKQGKRYRYYITHGSGIAKGDPGALRLPAADIEHIIVERVVTHLQETRLADQGLTVDDVQLRLAKTDRDIASLRSQSICDRRAVLRALVARIDLEDQALGITLLDSDGARSPTILTAELGRMRRGNDVQIVIRVMEAEPHFSRNEQLVQLMVDAYAARQLATNKIRKPVGEIAAAFGRSTPRFKRLLRLSYLAPDLVEAVLAGKQSACFTPRVVHDVTNLPITWAEQRRLLSGNEA